MEKSYEVWWRVKLIDIVKANKVPVKVGQRFSKQEVLRGRLVDSIYQVIEINECKIDCIRIA